MTAAAPKTSPTGEAPRACSFAQRDRTAGPARRSKGASAGPPVALERLTHRPDAYAADLLAALPASVLSATGADLNAVARVEAELVDAQAALEQLPHHAADPRARQHADARARIEAWLAPLHEDNADVPAALTHLDECTGTRAAEIHEHQAEMAGYGRGRVRVARCVDCGASAVINRRIDLPADPERPTRQRAATAASHD